MTSISSLVGGQMPDMKSMSSRIDANANGTISAEEFVNTRPQGISETEAQELYNSIDTEGTGALTQEQLQTGMAKHGPKLANGEEDTSSLLGSLSSDILAALMQMLQETGQTQQASAEMPSPDEIFSSLDANGDGLLSESEFVSGRPTFISEDLASSLFASMDTEGTGSLTQEQLESNMPDPSTMPNLADIMSEEGMDYASLFGDSSSSSSGSSDDLLQQLMAAIDAYRTRSSGNVDSSLTSSLLNGTA